MRLLSLLALALAGAQCFPALAAEELPLRAGFAATDITPSLDGPRPVYLAGYGMNRRATGVHDPLYARAVVLAAGDERIAMVAVDLIGLQYPTVKAIRARLPKFKFVLVASTHNHEGPDVIGLWGRGPFHRGVDDAYIDLVVERVVEAVQQAEQKLVPVTASFGTAEDETLLGDSRLPIVKDGVLRVVRFEKIDRASAAAPAGLVVQWNCHPEALGSRNTLITADFCWATVAALEKKYGCPVVLVSGAIGGLMAPPSGRIFDDEGNELKEGDFEYARRYGEEVAALAGRAIDEARPIELTPFAVAAKPIAVPIENVLYRAARALGVLKREGLVWMGDPSVFGEPMTERQPGVPTAVESEVACLRLGELYVACIPGELYPELVYGRFQEPADPGADFPDAPLEPTVAGLLPGDKWLCIGLANDEIGYIIPKRQWDKQPPYAYGRENPQYGEINSCGPDTAPIVMEALKQRVAELQRGR